jgi:alpha-beta hydrolase superfamily lysophospholipase
LGQNESRSTYLFLIVFRPFFGLFLSTTRIESTRLDLSLDLTTHHLLLFQLCLPLLYFTLHNTTLHNTTQNKTKDQYGHGFSEGTRFYIPSWEDNRNDLIEFVNLISNINSKSIPLFMAGESYGGCLTILVTKYFQDFPNQAPSNFDSCILIAPAIEGELPPFPVLQLLRYVLAPIAPKWTPFFMPNTVSADKIWKDIKISNYYTTPRKIEMNLDAIGKPFCLGTAVQLLKALEECRNNAISDNYNQSFCIVHGSNDIAVPVSGSKLLYNNCITSDENKELHIIDGSYHGILAEPEAEQAMEYIINYVDKRMKKFTTTSTSTSTTSK